MDITIIADNTNLTARDKDLIDSKIREKIQKLMKAFAHDMKKPTVKVRKINKKDKFKVNFNMWLPGKVQIFAEETDEVLLTALTNLSNQISRQIKEYKSKQKEFKK